jgi:hypothetical protein
MNADQASDYSHYECREAKPEVAFGGSCTVTTLM